MLIEKADSFDGRLPDAQEVLFEVPECKAFFLKFMILVNNSNGEQDVELWVDRGNGERRLIPKSTLYAANADAGKDLQGSVFVALKEGDTVLGRASADNVVDYLISYFMQVEE